MSPSYIAKRSSEHPSPFKVTSLEKLPHSPSTFTFRKVREDNDCFVALLMGSELRTAIEDSLLGRNNELLRSVFLQILTAAQCRQKVSAVHRESTLSRSNVSLGAETNGSSGPRIKSGMIPVSSSVALLYLISASPCSTVA